MTSTEQTPKISSSPQPLWYSQGSGSSRRRLFRSLIVLIAVGLSLYLGIKLAIPQSIAISNQWKAEASIAPPATVVYSDSPSLVAALRNNPLYSVDVSSWAGGKGAIHRHSIWLDDPDDRHSKTMSGLTVVGIMHARGAPSRLVGLSTFCEGGMQGKRVADFPTVEVRSRATFWPGTRDKQLSYIYDKLVLNDSDELTVYQGRIDPADPSHLTIDYVINNVKGIVDGWLKPNDKMVFFLRSGPATTRPSQRFLAAPLKWPQIIHEPSSPTTRIALTRGTRPSMSAAH